jgi:hypothetical protein
LSEQDTHLSSGQSKQLVSVQAKHYEPGTLAPKSLSIQKYPLTISHALQA